MCAHVLVCAKKVLAKSTAAFILTHGSIPSDLSIQKMNNPLFVFLPVVSFSDTTPLSPLPLFNSRSFFFTPLTLYLIISSSPAV